MKVPKLAALLVVVACLSLAPSARAAQTTYALYTVWLQGEGEANQQKVDDFLSCLVGSSNYLSYWSGQAEIAPQGSWVVPPPAKLGDAVDIGPFIDSLINSGKIPHPLAGATPVYEVFVDPLKTSTVLGSGTGGRNAPGTVQGGTTAGFVINTTNPSTYWPYRDALGSETQLSFHEVAEVIDGLRGGDRCSGDCCCEGWCNNAPSCNNLIGLDCPGAPQSQPTGCAGGSVVGYLVQRLSHQGTTTCNCPISCDFTPAMGCAGGGTVMNQQCSTTSQCCSGLSCEYWSYSGKAPYTTSCCKSVGDSCTTGTDCCGGSACDPGSHKCACVPAGQWCINATECCSGQTCDPTMNKCVAAPIDAGVPDASATPPADAAAEGGLGVPVSPDAAPPSLVGGEGGVDQGFPGGPTPAQGGCSCRMTHASRPGGGLAVACLAIAWLLTRRSRRPEVAG